MSEKDVVLDADGLRPAKTVAEIAEDLVKYGTGPRTYTPEETQEIIAEAQGKSPEQVQKILARNAANHRLRQDMIVALEAAKDPNAPSTESIQERINALLDGKSPEEIQELLASKPAEAATDIEGLSEKPVDVVVQHIADTAPPVVADPAASGSSTQQIVDAAYQKYNAQYVEDVKAIQEKAEARQTELVQEGLSSLSSAPKAPAKEVQGPLDELGDPLEMEDASNIKVAQMVWQMAIQKSRTKAGFEAVAAKLGKDAKDVLPLAVGNVALSAEMSKVVTEAYPDLTAMVWDAAKLNPGREMMVEAGYSDNVIKKIPQDVLDHWAISELHDTAFKQTGPSMVERLKEHKATIAEALSNDHVQRSLKWAGLIVGCATGGIVAKVGMKGIAFLAEKLGENPKVQELAKTLEDKSIKFVSQTFKIDEAKVREKVEHAKSVAEAVSHSKWATAAKVAAMVGLGVALGNLDFVHDAAMTVAEHSATAFHGATELASAALDTTQQAVVAAAGATLETVVKAGEAFEAGSIAVVDAVADGAVATQEFVATGAGQIAHGAAVAAKFTGDVIVDAGHATVEAAGIVKDAVVDTAHSVGSSTAEGLRVVADTVDPSVSDHVASAADRAAVDKYAAELVARNAALGAGPQIVMDHSDMSGLGETAGLGAKFSPADGVSFPTDSIGSASPDATAAVPTATAAVPTADAPSTPAPAAGPTVHEVKHGESLWKIAQHHLDANGGHASNTEIQNLVNKIYEDNKALIGNNPNLIFDHQSLVIDHPVSAPAIPGVDPARISAVMSDAPHHAAPTPVVHEHAHKATVDMLQTEALPNGSPAQISSYLNAITQRERIIDDGLQIS
jgi:hypothetical protein